MSSTGGSVKELRSQRSDVLESKNDRLSWVDMWALGISIVIGGQYFSWNAGVYVGFGSYVIAFFLISSAYMCLVSSVAELSSGLPFAGTSHRRLPFIILSSLIIYI
jgi:amino acid transporter